jgi:hypothetical protein
MLCFINLGKGISHFVLGLMLFGGLLVAAMGVVIFGIYRLFQ